MHKNVLNAIDVILNVHNLRNLNRFSALNINFDVLRSCRYQTVIRTCNDELISAEIAFMQTNTKSTSFKINSKKIINCD